MNKKLKVIMLVDDNPGDNYFHSREIWKVNPDYKIFQMNTGIQALEYLKKNKNSNSLLPDLIFLDINMPIMNGWEFLDEYVKLEKELQERIIIILSTTENPEDKKQSLENSSVTDFLSKPLTDKVFVNIVSKYF